MREAEQMLSLARHVLVMRGNVTKTTFSRPLVSKCGDDVNDRLLTISCEEGSALCSLLIRDHDDRPVLHAFWSPVASDGPPLIAVFRSGFWKEMLMRAAPLALRKMN